MTDRQRTYLYYSRDISASSAIEMYQWYCAI